MAAAASALKCGVSPAPPLPPFYRFAPPRVSASRSHVPHVAAATSAHVTAPPSSSSSSSLHVSDAAKSLQPGTSSSENLLHLHHHNAIMAVETATGEEAVQEMEMEMGTHETPLESTWQHRVWVAAAAAAVAGLMTKALAAAGSGLNPVAEILPGTAAACVAGYLSADLATGIYHWAIDNYGDARTPVFGPQIDAFQGHHKRPWTITKRQVANNLHGLARPATLALLPFLLANDAQIPGPVDAYVASFTAFVVLCQQFHAWAHSKRSELPGLVVVLQEAGVLVSRKMHGAHHRKPFDRNYSIVSGVWNPILDNSGFFRHAERFIFARWGVTPRSWSSNGHDQWQQEGSYFSDGTDIDHQGGP